MQVPYYRFNPEIPEFAMDESSLDKIEKLQRIGEEYMSSGRAAEDCAALAKLLSGRDNMSSRPLCLGETLPSFRQHSHQALGLSL